MLDFSVLIIRRAPAAKCWLCQIGKDSNIIAPLPLTHDASLDDALRHVLSRHPESEVYHQERTIRDERGRDVPVLRRYALERRT